MIVSFENPLAFFLLVFIPLLYVMRFMKILKPLAYPFTLGDWHGQYFRTTAHNSLALKFIVKFLGTASFVCLVTSYARPVVHHQEKVYSSRGSDILFVIDSSPSMASRDIGDRSRIDAAKDAIRFLASQNRGEALGIVEMAEEAAVLVPPTMDRNIFFDRLDSIMIGELGDGTAIGVGLSYAIMHLESSCSKKKCIVLITDGENNAGQIHPHTAARLAKEKGIEVFVLGLGTKGTVPLEYTDPKTGRLISGYLETNYDVETLAQIAYEGEGKFFEIQTMNALVQALEAMSKNVSVAQSYYIRNSDDDYSHYFLFASAVMILLLFFIKRICLQEVV